MEEIEQLQHMPNISQGYITGWREWTLVMDEGGASIKGIYGRNWPHKKPMIGEMLQVGFSQPGLHCFKTEEKLMSERISYFMLWGKVALWGEIYEHEHGYRGRYGYPLELNYYENDFIGEQKFLIKLVQNYGVPVKIWTRGRILKKTIMPIGDGVGYYTIEHQES